MVNANKIYLEDFPKTFFDLDQINKALDLLRAGSPGRVLIKM
jgi:Zn-dependent alcohol dehydrogenase